MFKYIIAAVFLIAAHSSTVLAADVGDVATFTIDENLDASQRAQVSAVLIKSEANLYFYVEKSWWDAQVSGKKSEVQNSLENLSQEFDAKIYPTLTSVFGSEWNPGVDGDKKITLLFHSMKEGMSGYFRSADEYLKLQVPGSNEREMLYFPTSQIESSRLKVAVAHEFVHLITFNQKERLRDVQEEVWLNEARADFSSHILGYDDVYEGSNLQKRVRDFLVKPTDSLTEWQESKYDYGVASMFAHYLVDHYGITVLSDSLKSRLTGIASINDVLLKNSYQENFSEVFTNWTIASFINDCSTDLKYCYLNKNLTGLKVNPALIFLPVSGSSSLSSTNVTKNWAGNWQKIIGGDGDLKLEFSSLTGLNFKVPYIVIDENNTYSIQRLNLDANEKGEINLKDFGSKYLSLIIIPSLQSKLAGFNGAELTHPYTIKATILGDVVQEEENIIQKLLAQIEALKKQIANLESGGNSGACASIQSNLYLGVVNKTEVTCLQSFLKSQGTSIYPEGLVTGNFGSLTRAAVIRFQEKYASEILAPAGFAKGTGFVGAFTRSKINALLSR
ncbi:MAG: peptidoglycan-binding protein [bacterium]|nr:peptidoglycan-binding protein [bacterium]